MADYTVEDAGTSAVNDDYSESGTHGGKAAYTNGTYWISWSYFDDAWCLDTTKVEIPAMACLYYAGATITGTWYVGEGDSPAPTVTECESGTVYEKDLTETVSIADVLSDAVTYVVGFTETISIADVLADAMTYGVPLAETMAVADAPGTGMVYGVPLTETMAVADGIARMPSLSLAEILSTGDALTDAVTYGVPLVETVAIADGIGSRITYAVGLSETVSIADVLADAVTYSVSLAETMTVADEVGKRMVYAVALAETMAVADAITRMPDLTLAEALAVADAMAIPVYRYWYLADASMSNAVGTIVEARLRVTSSSGGVDNGAWLSIQDGTHHFAVYLRADGLNIAGQANHAVDLTGWVRVRFAATGSGCEVWIDEDRRQSGGSLEATVSKQVAFGTYGDSGQAVLELDWLRVKPRN